MFEIFLASHRRELRWFRGGGRTHGTYWQVPMKKTGHGPIWHKFASWVASGGTVAAFARQEPARSERTLRRWSKAPDFVAEARRQSSEMTETIARRLRTITAVSTDELRKLLANPDPSIRLGAVRTALKSLVEIGRYADLESRIAALEDSTSGKP